LIFYELNKSCGGGARVAEKQGPETRDTIEGSRMNGVKP
jgi:hypothetical protein